MKPDPRRRIFAKVDAGDLVGRANVVERLAAQTRSGQGLVLLAAPGAGLSEVLRRVYDNLFLDQTDVTPFYFQFRPSDGSAENAASRFLHEFLIQAAAFGRRDPAMIDVAPGVEEIARRASPSDGDWVDLLVEEFSTKCRSGDAGFRVNNLFSSPLRVVPYGVRPFLLLDDVHVVRQFAGGDALFDELCDIFGRSGLPFVLGGRRRALYGRTTFETIPVEAFSFSEAGEFTERLARRLGVQITDQTRDLIAVQLNGNAANISRLLLSAASDGIPFTSFENVQRVYTDEIFGGRIGRGYDGLIEHTAPDAYSRERLLWLLNENANASGGRAPASYWKRHSDGMNADLELVLEGLHESEIINFGDGFVGIDPSDVVLGDYLNAGRRLEIERETRAIVVGESLTANIKRAPRLLARYYRQNSAIGLQDLLSSFDGRRVSPALLDYERFKDEFKGVDDEKILRSIKEDNAGIDLPNIVYTADTDTFYPKLREIADPSRSVTGLGFHGKEKTAWLVAQIDSKLEATSELAGFWCDRLEMAAMNANFETFKLWLIAPEGFSVEAMHLLRERDAYGSSRKQIELLALTLNAEISQSGAEVKDEYEVVIPMGEDTEMIAAHTVEEIARRHNFPTRAINQIKTALVEACINATEHSMSPDRRIHQRFSVSSDRITISVTNRGLRLADKREPDGPVSDARRGWGLKLIKSLMDEVRVESTDDGTQLTMVKYLHRDAAAMAEQG